MYTFVHGSIILSRVRSHLEFNDADDDGTVTFDEFFSALTGFSAIEKKDAQQIFNLNTANGRSVRIDVFMERLDSNKDSVGHNKSASIHSNHSSNNDLDSLIKDVFAVGTPKPEDEQDQGNQSELEKDKSPTLKKKTSSGKKNANSNSKKKAKSNSTKKNKKTKKPIVAAKKKNSFEQLKDKIQKIDKDEDGKINLDEFWQLCQTLQLELTNNEAKQIYQHSQQLTTDFKLPLHDFFDHIKEEYLSFPELSPEELLLRLFAKTIQ
ncbi:serine-rich 25 kDa antigen protein, partial [Reticulomyxa filosa]